MQIQLEKFLTVNLISFKVNLRAIRGIKKLLKRLEKKKEKKKKHYV
jgi:hypothetical protein